MMNLTIKPSSSIFLKRGLLNSAYKKEVAYSFAHLKNNTIFNLRERALNNHNRLCCTTAVVLKIAVFAIAMLFVFL